MRGQLEKEINNLVIFKPYSWRGTYADFITGILPVIVKEAIIEIQLDILINTWKTEGLVIF